MTATRIELHYSDDLARFNVGYTNLENAPIQDIEFLIQILDYIRTEAVQIRTRLLE